MASLPDQVMNNMAEQLKRQKEILAAAKRFEGQLPTTRPTRAEIEMNFLMMGVRVTYDFHLA